MALTPHEKKVVLDELAKAQGPDLAQYRDGYRAANTSAFDNSMASTTSSQQASMIHMIFQFYL